LVGTITASVVPVTLGLVGTTMASVVTTGAGCVL
jgi:hypothetical protein